MKLMQIEGGRDLTGTIRISGAKNATVALIPAAILTDEEATICNIPEITDTDALCDILKALNVKVNRASESLVIDPTNMQNIEIGDFAQKTLYKSEILCYNRYVGAVRAPFFIPSPTRARAI